MKGNLTTALRAVCKLDHRPRFGMAVYRLVEFSLKNGYLQSGIALQSNPMARKTTTGVQATSGAASIGVKKAQRGGPGRLGSLRGTLWQSQIAAALWWDGERISHHPNGQLLIAIDGSTAV